MEARKLFVLDYSKWRSGDDGDNKLGEGDTMLRNREGFCCCLGMFSEQYGVPQKLTLGNACPSGTGIEIPLLTRGKGKRCVEMSLSTELMRINDDKLTTSEEKIKEIRKLLKEKGVKLRVINKPKK